MKMIEEMLVDTNIRMEKAVGALIQELGVIRTGRATPALVEHIKVDYHGVPTSINQIASISVPDARMIFIQPWDRTSVRSVEKAILASDLGLNPMCDGNVIRIAIPPLNEERRKELIKISRKRLEESRVAVRNIRRETMERLREAQRGKDLSEDQYSSAMERLQKLTDTFIEKVNQIGQDKEPEIMEV